MIIQHDVLIFSVVFQKAAGYGSERHKAELFVKSVCGCVAFYNSVKLKNPKAEVFCGIKTVADELFSDMIAPQAAFYGEACVRYMAAAPDVVGVQDIKSDNFAGFCVLADAAAALRSEKVYAFIIG